MSGEGNGKALEIASAVAGKLDVVLLMLEAAEESREKTRSAVSELTRRVDDLERERRERAAAGEREVKQHQDRRANIGILLSLLALLVTVWKAVRG